MTPPEVAGYQLTRLSPFERTMGEAPPQHPEGERCSECGRTLSIYNPHTICGPCRVRVIGRIAMQVVDDETDDCTVVEFPRRKPVRSGPLDPDQPTE